MTQRSTALSPESGSCVTAPVVGATASEEAVSPAPCLSRESCCATAFCCETLSVHPTCTVEVGARVIVRASARPSDYAFLFISKAPFFSVLVPVRQSRA